MNSYTVKVWFKWHLFPKKFSIIHHNIINELNLLNLELTNKEIVLFSMSRIKKLEFSSELSRLVQERAENGVEKVSK